MQTLHALGKRYRAERGRAPFHSLPRLGDDGLTLGCGTVLTPVASDAAIDGERVVALLAAVHGRLPSRDVVKCCARAARRWRAGEAALAHIELAFARLPPLAGADDAFRLFLAEHLLADGMTPRALARELGFDADLSKYAPDQPRRRLHLRLHLRLHQSLKIRRSCQTSSCLHRIGQHAS